MEAAEASNDVVHPEVRAHINSLVSALGGTSADDDGRYKLGDDALEVLRDMKRWIRFYDEKTNRMDVARCLAEANVVGGDLLPILALWPEAEADSRLRARIAFAIRYINKLTWPIERDPERTTVNHYRHMPVLQLAQLAYKRDIVNYDGAQILHTAIRVALPSMAIPAADRSPRDQGIIKLVLYFLRNVAAIAPPPGLGYDGDESQISRSATIDAFSYQDVFLALLTVASNMGDDFRTEDVIVMEIIFHLVKRVDISKLFLDEDALGHAKADDLANLIKKEKAMLQSHNKRGPTRHNRFGTMVWVQRADGRMSAVSGQDALRDKASRERKMDESKTFRPARKSRKPEMEPKDLGPPVSLNPRANTQLRRFVEDFLDSAFNPLFQHVRKTIERDAPYLLHQHRAQFFYLVSWFLEAERVRIKTDKDKKKKKKPVPAAAAPPPEDEVSPFNLVAAVLTQEMFVAMNRALDRAYNDKDWQELTTVMRCFTQILLTVQDMADAGGEENEDIADNILNRLFYEETTHDFIANIARTFKDQGFEYLDACTELTHTYLRILEAYSKQNVDMQVRSRKRTRKKKKAAAAEAEGENLIDGGPGPNGGADSGDEDEAQAERTSRERKFDFSRFAARFVPQGVVDTFVAFTRYYRDLDDAQLKRAHRYFFRVAFKQDMSVMLFRVDIIHLLYNMVRGPDALPKTSATFRDWEELVKQVTRKCVRKIEERPALIIEMLFSKINSTAHYLEFGFEKQTLATGSSGKPRPAAELEFKPTAGIEGLDRQIAVAVGVLLDKNMAEHLDWVKEKLQDAESERRAWEVADMAMPSVETSGGVEGEEGAAEKPSEPRVPKEHSDTVVQPDTEARRLAMFKNPHLRLLMKLVGFERLSPDTDETPESVWIIPARLGADDLLEHLTNISAAEFSPPLGDDGDDVVPGAAAVKSTKASAEGGKKATTRKKKNKAAFLDDSDDDDDDSNDDDGSEDSSDTGSVGKRKRKSHSGDDEDDSDGTAGARSPSPPKRKTVKRRKKAAAAAFIASDDDDDDDDGGGGEKDDAPGASAAAADVDMDDDDEDDEPVAKAPPQKRGRAKAGFVVDSSDEE
ncbi:topoisomerase 1-associated factor 1 [Magnaporthiopsis poae ATCC 64411]|uniref:Topoisomerase 1-associated factor 1 n=1 Tax=Magnaporthiopsis poae (strain ATCC 64411 / 73-15) TaxID=644358 RepID=A0A0C4E8Y3_MAGP6|nr:topoisomerase 1-associated factor 1 [Magnaporthiopsis poae ATCC 64411]